MKMIPERLTEEGARVCAKTIKTYWMGRGYAPEVTVVTSENPDSHWRTRGIFVVRSDMIDAMPRPASKIAGVA